MRSLKYLFASALMLSAQGYSNEFFGDGGFKVYADYLYWQASQDQMAYAAVLPGGVQQIIDNVTAGDSDFVEQVHFVEPSFKFESGFKVGVGYEAPCSGWDAEIEWTSLHFKRSSSVFEDNQGVFPLTDPATVLFGFLNRDPSDFGFASSAFQRWKFEYDAFDFRVGKACNLCDCFKVRPYVGVKAASIRQKQFIEYFGFTVDEGDDVIGVVIDQNLKKNDFHGAGPSIGVDMAWNIFRDFNLTASAGGALLCGKFDVKQHPFVAFDDFSVLFEAKNNRKNRIRPVADASIGLDWATTFCNGFGLEIGLSYEVQYWWNQWQAAPSVIGSILNGGNGSQGDLMLQGLTAEVAFTF